jgi:proliferating cell nuclear antigen PCNA
MTIKLKAGYELIKVFSAIGQITDEATLDFKPEGLSISELAPTGISMSSVDMKPSLLKEYVANQELKVGVNLENFNAMLKMLDKSDFTISVANNILEVKTEHKSFSVPIIDVKNQANKMPEIEYTNIVKINAKELKTTLKDIKQISEVVHFYINNNTLTLQAEGDAGSVENKYTNAVIKSTEPITNTCFTIEAMQQLIKEANNKDTVELYLKQEQPLKVVITLAGQIVRSYIAPYMEN